MSPDSNNSNSNQPSGTIHAVHAWGQEIVYPGQTDGTTPLPDPAEGVSFEIYEESHTTLADFAASLDGMEWGDETDGGLGQDPGAIQVQWAYRTLLPMWKDTVGSDGIMLINTSIYIPPLTWIEPPGGGVLAQFGKTVDGAERFAVSKSPEDRLYILQVSFHPMD